MRHAAGGPNGGGIEVDLCPLAELTRCLAIEFDRFAERDAQLPPPIGLKHLARIGVVNWAGKPAVQVRRPGSAVR